MMKIVGSLSAVLLAMGTGSITYPHVSATSAFFIAGGAWGLGTVLGSIADSLIARGDSPH